MRKVKVKIKPSIASKGCGFVDIEGKQEIFPRDEKGELTPDKTFEVSETPFVRRKIETGELVLLCEVFETVKVKVALNGEEIDAMEINRGMTEDDILATIEKRKKVMAAVKDKGIKALEFDAEEIRIITE